MPGAELADLYYYPSGGGLQFRTGAYTPFGNTYFNQYWPTLGELASSLGVGAGAGTSGASGATPVAPAEFTYPTPAETYSTVSNLPYMTAQTNLLNQMGSYPAWHSAVYPQVTSALKTLGRSGYPSSSYADRIMANTMSSLWNNWQWNVAQGWQDIGRQMPLMMQQWYSPYNTMLGLISG